MNVQVNNIVEVKVKRVEQYGVIVECEGKEGIVLIPNLSWDVYGIQEKIHEMFIPEQILKAKVLDHETTPFNASFKDANPELNPWGNIDKYILNHTYEAKVVAKTGFGYFVELEKGLRALLRNENSGAELSEGNIVSVNILDIDETNQKVEVSYLSNK
ncbi:S1 RNA-binding domain-containing protein [Pseudoalteromonas luteoviolacea]|uniref:S1 RNA-binding domain-containing protein n=1 Tax=Pseudoalteromonas luteoviolacea TaxID=43657 RepID=UPI001B3597DB|nr:S1 RNA-binding domain-containing protein [Pseudoalteromonas luteoviolacea]MBQ4811521.1 S1 RNA-binding domain-containing protein [Pseudoalteromonas luteoviolacea]